MGGSLCRALCCRPSDSGDALDRLLPEQPDAPRQRAKPYAERTVEEFLGAPASCYDRNYCNFMMWMTTGGYPQTDPAARVIPFVAKPSPIVKGLQILTPASEEEAAQIVSQLRGTQKVIVGSVRMGYGHHRIAYSALTWALELGAEPFLLDILAPECIESDIVKNMDKHYSSMSRLASSCGGWIDEMWGKMMLQGDANALRCCVALSQKIRPIMAGFPKDVPVISSHPIIGNMAVACGFKKVINLVFDNWPQYFVLVPGAINLVQSPSYFDKLLDMGCPASSIRMAGHWVSSDMCLHVAQDSEARIARCRRDLPRRFLITVGGAGAQKAYLASLLEGLAPKLMEKKLRIFVNCGDHKHISEAVEKKLQQLGLEWDEVNTSEQTEELCRSQPLSALSEPANWKAVTLLRFDSHFAAFRCTDLVIRIADVLVTKPSELAFFPIPKLHIRRVGEHEAYSAVRSTELGDGTVECRVVPHALKKADMLMQRNSPLFLLMNESIMKAARIGAYEGSKVACQYACPDLTSPESPLQR